MSRRGEYAALRSAHGQRRVAALRRRRDYLTGLLASGESTLDHDRSEASALFWLIEKANELRGRLDDVVRVVERDAPAIAETVREIAEERPDRHSGNG